MKAREAVTQHVVAESAGGADPLLQGRLGQFRFELLKAGQAEDETMKDGEEDGGGGDLGIVAGIRQFRCGGAEMENFVQVASKGG
jgi:hypothetical protein